MPKLFLYSLAINDHHFDRLDRLVGKNRRDITMGLITHAADIIENADGWVSGLIGSIQDKGYKTHKIDLRKDAQAALDFDDLDVLWVCGGHTYYLRWILAESGADKAIKTFVQQGKVYMGWSAGAVVAGPTTRHFDLMGDRPDAAPRVWYEGLHLTDKVVVPHMDNPDFEKSAALTNEVLIADGFTTIPLRDHQVMVIDGGQEEML